MAFAIAHTRGPVFSDSALVDATAARCGQQDELHTQMGPLQEAIKVRMLRSTYSVVCVH